MISRTTTKAFFFHYVCLLLSPLIAAVPASSFAYLNPFAPMQHMLDQMRSSLGFFTQVKDNEAVTTIIKHREPIKAKTETISNSGSEQILLDGEATMRQDQELEDNTIIFLGIVGDDVKEKKAQYEH